MSSYPIIREDVERITKLKELFVGAHLECAYYRQTLSSGLGVAPVRDVHEVDLDLVLGLSTGIVCISWERADLVEGLAVDFPESVRDLDDTATVLASESAQWQPCVQKRILNVHFGWQVSEVDCPESLWAVRISFETGAEVVVALGEVDADGTPAYNPDSLVVLFSESVARSYGPLGAIGSSWAERSE